MRTILIFSNSPPYPRTITITSKQKVSKNVILNMLHHKYCSPKLLEFLIENHSDDILILSLVAKHQDCNENTLQKIFDKVTKTGYEEKYRIVYRAFAMNNNCSPSILEYVYSFYSSKSDIFKTILRNKNCPLKILERIINCSDFIDLKAEVAKNPSCTVDMLNKLLKTNHKLINNLVQLHPNYRPQ